MSEEYVRVAKGKERVKTMSKNAWDSSKDRLSKQGYRLQTKKEAMSDLGIPEEAEATEAAIELALENDIPLNTVKGTGANGTITKPDVQKVKSKKEAEAK